MRSGVATRVWSGVRIAAIAALVCFAAGRAAQAQEKPPGDLTQISLDDLLKVEADSVSGASKFLQKVTRVPASVTIVTAQDIQRYGYRTLGDVLRRVRGLYVINDRNYSYVGVRGFSQPGDYNARILFLLDGHRVNDNIFDGTYVGTEFPVDLDLVDRIEIIRGASSSLYGNGAFLAVVNVITKRGRDLAAAEVSTEIASWDSYKGRVSYGNRFQNGLETLLSGSLYTSEGHSRLYYPEFDHPATNNGIAQNADGDGAYSMFADIIFRDFNIHVVQASRTKHIPTGSFGTVFNDSRNRTTDARGYVDLEYARQLGEKWDFFGRVAYDWYNYSGVYVYDYTGAGVPPYTENEDLAMGKWWAFELAASRVWRKRHRLTLGTEFRQDLRQEQLNYDLSPYKNYLDDRRTSRVAAYYLQDEFSLRENLIFVAGLRCDSYKDFGSTYSPRLSLIYSPAPATTIKLVGNAAFRAPNRYESYYVSSTSDAANPGLRPERMRSLEANVDHSFSSRYRLAASAFYNRINGLIESATDLATGNAVYANRSTLSARGFGGEFAAKWSSGLEGVASYTFQDWRNLSTGVFPANSPRHVAKANLSIPLLNRKLFAGLEGQYESRRRTVSGDELGGVFLANVTLFARNLKRGFDLSASIYNLFDKRYAESGGTEHRQGSIPQDGRSFRIKLTYRFPGASETPQRAGTGK